MPRNQLREESPSETRRLNRILSLAGLSSRRSADTLIVSGRITVNGRTVTEAGSRAVWGKDSIKFDGQEIPPPFARTYLMLNKPFGTVCTLRDPAGRPTVSDLLKDLKQRVYPVGRLDFDSLGLLLFTNDGEWAHRLTHPRFHVPKTYKITLAGEVSDGVLNALRKGVHLDDGFSGPSKITLLEQRGGTSTLRMTITMGRNRIIRRMAEASGLNVVHLIRTGFGLLELGDLKIGHYRHLDVDEVEALKKMVGLI